MDEINDRNGEPVEMLAITNEPVSRYVERATHYAQKSRADNTRKAYQSDWHHFLNWCKAHGAEPLPASPATVAAYIASLADEGRKASTIERRLTSISQAHGRARLDSPRHTRAVRETFAGIRRAIGTKQEGKAALPVSVLQKSIELLPASLLGIRNAAILLVGFWGAFRRSELVALMVEDLRFVPEGLVIELKRSKMDQEGEGQVKAIPFGRCADVCPVGALRLWLDRAGIESGPVFRAVDKRGRVGARAIGDRAVAELVKAIAEGVGLDPGLFSGHSLRAGFATAAAMGGAEERDIMRQTGHSSLVQVRKYIRGAELFKNHAARAAGL